MRWTEPQEVKATLASFRDGGLRGVCHHEAAEILLRLNRDFPERPAIIRRLVVVFEQLRNTGKASAFLKAFGRDNPNDTWISEKRERFAALGFR